MAPRARWERALGARKARPPLHFSSVPFPTLESRPCASSAASNHGAKHLGNHSGGFRQYAATQEEGDAFFCIVDLHSITITYDPENLRRSSLDLAAMVFATGLDPERSTLRAEPRRRTPRGGLAALAVADYGQLGRMTQFKEKGERQEFVSAGFFT